MNPIRTFTDTAAPSRDRSTPSQAWSRRWRVRTAAALGLAIAGLGGAHAATTLFNFDPGANWRTTTDRLVGQQWALGNFDASQGIAVQTGYGNPDTTSLPVDSMMWNCGPGGDLCRNAQGDITGGDGPLEAFFGYGFRIEPGTQALSAVMRVIADDFFHLRVNGFSVMAAMLDDHLDGNGQPLPMAVDITQYLRAGDNVVSLRAMDGTLKGAAASCAQGVEVTSVLGAFCKYDRGNEYVSVAGGVLTVPEPGSLALVGASLGLLAVFARARPATTGAGGRSA